MEEFKPMWQVAIRVCKVVNSVEVLEHLLYTCDNCTIFVTHDVELKQEYIEKAKARFIGIQIVKNMHEVRVYINDVGLKI